MDYDDPDYYTKSDRRPCGGLVLVVVASLPFPIGVGRLGRNWSSVKQVQMVADERFGAVN